MFRVIVSLGSNYGNSNKIILDSINTISKFFEIKKQTQIIETIPFGNINQNNFLNCLIEIETEYYPHKLFKCLKKIEKKYNKKYKKNVFWGSRALDLDIIQYDIIKLFSNNLIIPHDGLHKRDYLKKLMNEINDRKLL